MSQIAGMYGAGTAALDPPTGHTVDVDLIAVVAISYVLGSAWFTCAFLTGLAAYRRGLHVLPVLLAAVLFPATWTVWHLQDERPLRAVSLCGRMTP